MQKKRKIALVTGASSGLGLAIARELARRGYNLILTARSESTMVQLANELRKNHGADALVEVLDLSQPGSAAELQSRLDARGIVPDALVNNAAFGIAEPFVQHDPAHLLSMLNLNVVALTELSLLFGRRMAAAGHGHILLVASMAAFLPAPLLAAYGASKAYVLSLGEALHVELAPAVTVTVLSPGLMDTGFNPASGFKAPESAKRGALPPEKVAAIGLDALFAGKATLVAGRQNAIMAFASRFIPRQAAARGIYRMSGGGAAA